VFSIVDRQLKVSLANNIVNIVVVILGLVLLLVLGSRGVVA